MIAFSVRRPVAISMLCIGIVLLGWISLSRIPVQLMPNIESAEYTVVTLFKGATPAEVESQITDGIERAVSTVPGLLSSSSISLPDRSEIRLKFSSHVDSFETISVLRDRLDGASLPEGVSKPKIVRSSANAEPVIRVALKRRSATMTSVEFSRVIRETLVRKIEAIDGVALTQVSGDSTQSLQIDVDPTLSANFNISLGSIADAIQNRNRSWPAGDVTFEGRRTPVKLGLSIEDEEQLKAVVVKKDDDRLTRLGDISHIRKLDNKPAIRTRLNGDESLLLDVRKEAEANSVEVARRARAVVESYLAENRDVAEGFILVDQGVEIQAAINDVSDSVIQGGLLAALVIFLLIQTVWPTFVVSITIPLSLFLTIVCMHFFGMTFNVMSLSGLALGVGMLVDNSTVVLDAIHNMRATIQDPREAAVVGARQVAGAITASTLSTMAVFGPLAFVEGTIGKIFRDVALAISFSIASSLVVALVVIPMLCALELGWRPKPVRALSELLRDLLPNAPQVATAPPIFSVISVGAAAATTVLRTLFAISLRLVGLVFSRLIHVLKPLYGWVVEPTLRQMSEWMYSAEKGLRRQLGQIMINSKPILTIALVSAVIGFGIFSFLGSELFPDESYNRLTYELEFPPGWTLDTTEAKVKAIEQTIRSMAGLESLAVQVGESGTHTATLMVVADPKHLSEISSSISAILTRTPDLRVTRKKKVLVGEGKPVQIEILGDDLSKIGEQAARTVKILRGIDGLVDVESSRKPDVSELSILFSKERLTALNVDSGAFVAPLKTALTGVAGGSLQFQGSDLPVRISNPAGYFDSFNKIRDFAVATEDDRRLYLSEVAKIEEHKVEGSIHHQDRKRLEIVAANLSGIDLQAAISKIESSMSQNFKPGEIKWRVGGQDQERKESTKSLLMAVGLSILLIYLMLASQFESLVQPAIILCAVPLSICGVAVALVLFGLNLSALVFVGFIMLVGVTVNASIVMIDFANQLVLEGRSPEEAITEATVRRLKPIVVTTATSILGLVPMAFAQGAAMQRPLAVTMIGGHFSSTYLTLLVVPPIYVWFARRNATKNG